MTEEKPKLERMKVRGIPLVRMEHTSWVREDNPESMDVFTTRWMDGSWTARVFVYGTATARHRTRTIEMSAKSIQGEKAAVRAAVEKVVDHIETLAKAIAPAEGK